MNMKQKNPAAVAMAKARARSLSPERRREIARQAAATRWAKGKARKGKGR
jgi:hypothetical protein